MVLMMTAQSTSYIVETYRFKNFCGFFALFQKSNRHYTRRITPKRVTSGGAYLRDLAPGLHSSEETSQQWRAAGDTVPI